MPGTEDNAVDYTDSAGRPSDTAPGPRGQRMAQLGILTRAQKRKPVLPTMKLNAEGKPNPGELENIKMESNLAQKAADQRAALMQQGPANTISESDPMKRSLVSRGPMQVKR